MVQGLAEYRKRKEEEEARREEAKKPKFNRFALQKDGDSVVVRFAQEIDFSAKNYDESRGIGFVNVEHKCGDDPKNGWKNRANCSDESQGACFPCEKVKDYDVDWNQRKGWKQQEKFYINLIAGAPREEVETVNGQEKKRYFTTDIDKKTGDGEVYLLEQSTHNGIYDDLANYFLEEELSGATITDKFFKITRKGNLYNNTEYSVLALKEIPKGAKDLSEFELVNITEDALKEVPYAQQEAFYFRGVSARAEETPAESQEDRQPVGAGSTGSNEKW
jgi:hypothetical protein